MPHSTGRRPPFSPVLPDFSELGETEPWLMLPEPWLRPPLFPQPTAQDLSRIDLLRKLGLPPLGYPQDPYGPSTLTRGAPTSVQAPAQMPTQEILPESPLGQGGRYLPRAQQRQGPTTLDRIMNAIGAGGQGLLGRVSPGPMIEMERARRKFEAEQEEQQASILEHGLLTMTKLAPLVRGNPKLADDLSESILMPMFRASGFASQAADPDAAHGRLQATLAAMLRGRGTMTAEQLTSGMKWVTDADREIAYEHYLNGEGDKAMNGLREAAEARKAEFRARLLAKIAQDPDYVSAMPPELQEVARELLATASKEELERVGIPSKALPLITAERAAEEATPAGRQRLATSQAQELQARTATALAPIKAIPGQGALVDVSGAMGLPPGTLPPGPVGPPPAGMATAAPGVRVLGAMPPAPGPGVSGEVAKTVLGLEQMTESAKVVEAIANSGAVDDYIGPWTTMSRFNEMIARKITGPPPELVILDQAEQAMKNRLIVWITGAALNKDEQPRIFNELPDRTTQTKAEYLVKARIMAYYAPIIEARYKALVGPDGRKKAGVNEEAVYKKHPLPTTAEVIKLLTGKQKNKPLRLAD